MAESKSPAAKQAQATKDEVDAVKATDPTEIGDVDERRTLTAGVGPDAVVIRSGEAPSKVGDTTDGDEFITVAKDVVEEFYFPDTTRPSYRILFAKGQVIRKSVLDELERAAERSKRLAENDGVDPDNPAGIDSTTIASGTRVKPVEDDKGK